MSADDSVPRLPADASTSSGGGCGGGCLLGTIGLVVGSIIGGVLPIHFERVRSPGVEVVRLTVLGAEVRRAAGPPGELNRALKSVRTMLVAGLGLLGGAVGAGLGAVSQGSRENS